MAKRVGLGEWYRGTYVVLSLLAISHMSTGTIELDIFIRDPINGV